MLLKYQRKLIVIVIKGIISLLNKKISNIKIWREKEIGKGKKKERGAII